MRFLLVVVLVGLIAAWWLGYLPPRGTPDEVRTVNPATARQRGAEVGERVAEGVNRLSAEVDDAALTAKIKSKMALDDKVQARHIDVTTTGGTVTLSGSVGSADERERAVALARETNGVRTVIDHLAGPGDGTRP